MSHKRVTSVHSATTAGGGQSHVFSSALANLRNNTAGGNNSRDKGQPPQSYFEQQREMYMLDIATSFEHVLASLNKLNRGLEATIAVGNEFSSVEALWSQFESVMVQPQTQPSISDDQQQKEDRIGEQPEDKSIL